ncbi:MAG: PEGA domain-containing protein [Armatimonadia bacterium]|nr:PEGA domain-containing protein [Armatimonadia bacterium]
MSGTTISGRARALGLALFFASCGAAHATPLVLTSEPASATVQLNGEEMGVTPLTLNIADTFVGAAEVRFSHEGYVPLTVEVVVNPGQQITLKAVLTSLQELSAPSPGPGVTPPGPGELASQARERIRQAVVAFRADCGAWPAVLADITAPTADDLSRLFNDAGETIVAEGYRGPYLDALPVDPSTGAVDWTYDSATGEVTSRGTAPAEATMPPAAFGPGQITVEEWVALLLDATGMEHRPTSPAPTVRPVDPGPPTTEPGGATFDPEPVGPALDWRPIGG